MRSKFCFGDLKIFLVELCRLLERCFVKFINRFDRSVNYVSNLTENFRCKFHPLADYSIRLRIPFVPLKKEIRMNLRSIQMSQNLDCLVLVYINEISEFLGGFLSTFQLLVLLIAYAYLFLRIKSFD